MSLKHRGWLWLLFLTALLLLLAAPVATYPLGRDQGEFATIGRGILEGTPPYTGLWNPKPPAVFYTYALAMQVMGTSVMALRLIDLLLLPVMCAALYAIGVRIASRAVGLWAALLYGVFYFTETFWTLTQNDGIAAVPMTLAVLCTLLTLNTADTRQAILFAFLSGALCALALWFKYPFISFVIAVVVGYLLLRRVLAWGEVAGFVAGGLLVGLGGIGYMASIGALAALVESANVTAGYTAQGYDLGVFWADLRNYAGFRWRHWHVLWVLAVLWPLLHRQKTADSPEFHVTHGKGWRIIGLWLIGSIVAMLMQAKGYDYHWLPMLPPLALFAAASLDQLVRHTQTRFGLSPGLPTGKLIVLLPAALLLMLLASQTWGRSFLYLSNQESRQAYYARFQGGEFIADESLQVAEYLEARLPAGESLFIWGFRPEIYYMSGLRPAARFIFQFPLVAEWYPQAWQQQTVDTLWASLPPYVLVLRGDFMPWVTGIDADSNTLLQDYTELNNWLIFNYEQETEIGNFLIWRRKS